MGPPRAVGRGRARRTRRAHRRRVGRRPCGGARTRGRRPRRHVRTPHRRAGACPRRGAAGPRRGGWTPTTACGWSTARTSAPTAEGSLGHPGDVAAGDVRVRAPAPVRPRAGHRRHGPVLRRGPGRHRRGGPGRRPARLHAPLGRRAPQHAGAWRAPARRCSSPTWPRSPSAIRIGSGGVMLPNHAPLVVAEQFAMLEALHPGRIDLGIGRAPGTDQQTALALRRDPPRSRPRTSRSTCSTCSACSATSGSAGGLAERFVATPAARTAPQVVLLGSSGFSAQLAGALGLPFDFAHHFGTHAQAAVELYRDSFRPSPALEPAVHDGHRERADRRHRRGGAAAGPARAADDAGHPHQPAAGRAEPGRGGGRPGAGRGRGHADELDRRGARRARSRSCAGSPRTPARTRSWSRPAPTARPSGCAAWNCSPAAGACRRRRGAPPPEPPTLPASCAHRGGSWLTAAGAPGRPPMISSADHRRRSRQRPRWR